MMLYAKVAGVVLLTVFAAAAQEPNKESPLRTIVLDIDVIDVNVEQPGEIERMIKDKRQLDRLIADGKAHPIAGIQMRGRSGEQTSARMGQRLPERSMATQGTPQIQYENTGLSVDFTPRVLEAEKIEVKLKIDWSAVVRNDNFFGPMFIQRTISDVVTVKNGEPTALISVTQHEGLLPALPKSGSKPGDSAGGNFVIVLNARLLD